MDIDFLPDKVKPKNDKNKPHEPKLAKKTVEALELVFDHGIEPRKALIMASGNPRPHYNTVHQFKAKCKKWGIERPAAQKIAHTALIQFAAGRPVNGIEPKSIDVRAAAERIIDQTTPVMRRTEALNINMDISPVDLSRYLREGI